MVALQDEKRLWIALELKSPESYTQTHRQTDIDNSIISSDKNSVLVSYDLIYLIVEKYFSSKILYLWKLSF